MDETDLELRHISIHGLSELPRIPEPPEGDDVLCLTLTEETTRYTAAYEFVLCLGAFGIYRVGDVVLHVYPKAAPPRTVH